MKNIGTLAIAFLIFAALTGYAMADRPVNQTPETQGITTTTVIYCTGTVTHSTEAVWQQSGATDNVNAVLDQPPLAATESQYVMSYNQNMIADKGYTELTTEKSLDTANKVANQDNFRSTTMLDFIGSQTGYVTYDESTLIDGAGRPSTTAGAMLCPFSSAISENIPAFCNIVEMGGSFDGRMVSMITKVNERHVSATADTPVGLGYEFKVQPGEGTASAWINAHLMEGRGTNELPSLDIIYNEKSSAMGSIDLFYKKFDYSSGMRRA